MEDVNWISGSEQTQLAGFSAHGHISSGSTKSMEFLKKTKDYAPQINYKIHGCLIFTHDTESLNTLTNKLVIILPRNN